MKHFENFENFGNEDKRYYAIVTTGRQGLAVNVNNGGITDFRYIKDIDISEVKKHTLKEANDLMPGIEREYHSQLYFKIILFEELEMQINLTKYNL